MINRRAAEAGAPDDQRARGGSRGAGMINGRAAEASAPE
jgi:hypothetical protein